MMLRLGWSGASENGEILLVNLLIFSGVCATVYLMTGHSFRSWRFVFMPDIVVLRTEPVRLLAYGATGIFTNFAMRPSILRGR